MNPYAFHFSDPNWLWLAGLGPLVLVAWHLRTAAKRRRLMNSMVSATQRGWLATSHSPARRQFKEFLLTLSVMLIGLSMARPQWGRIKDNMNQTGADVVFVLDCSLSMTTRDAVPDRLDRAKLSILQFVRTQGLGRLGLVAFAGSSFLECPLTYDREAFEETLMDLNEKALPVPGTDIGGALLEAAKAMDPQSHQKRVILLTDGEDLEQTGVNEARQLATNQVVVFTVGVGTQGGGSIRIQSPGGASDWLRDDQGRVVCSRLDESTLRQIAEITGGRYHPLGLLGEGLMQVGPDLNRLETPRSNRGGRGVDWYGVDRQYWPLGLALALLAWEPLMGTRRASKKEQSPAPGAP